MGGRYCCLFLACLPLPMQPCWSQPGVDSVTVLAIQSAIQSLPRQDLELTTIVNIDSSKGNPAVQGGWIEDPYNTLTGCYIFAADNSRELGCVGVYRDGQILWHSDSLVFIPGGISEGSILTSDLNSDGTVEILTTWEGTGQEGPKYLWIFSWTGSEASLVSATSDDPDSVVWGRTSDIVTYNSSTFGLADFEGDGIWEILGFDLVSEGVVDENGEVPKTTAPIVYYWDGSKYAIASAERYPRIEQPLPRNRLEPQLSVRITPDGGRLVFDFRLVNSIESIQRLVDFHVHHEEGLSLVCAAPPQWTCFNQGPLATWHSVLASPAGGSIKPGMEQGGFRLDSPGTAVLVGPVRWYARGFNFEFPVEDPMLAYQDILENSAGGFTLGPLSAPPEFAVAVDTVCGYAELVYRLGWIRDPVKTDSILTLLTSSRANFEIGDFGAARTTLQSLFQYVQGDGGRAFSNEAYALLRFNTEYLLGRLPIGSAPALASLTPGMTLTGSGSFLLFVKCSGFYEGATILWNGTACATTLVSSTRLKSRIPASATASPINVPITVRNPDGSTSGQLTFAAVVTLPAPVRPVLDCVRKRDDEHYTAWFGYQNDNPVAVYIPVGTRNKFTPSPRDRDQPTIFLPGRAVRAFSVTFPGTNLVWTLNGRTATASKNSSRCH
jgi:hypothetical protein